MQKGFEKTYHQFEKNHFWFKSRRNFITNWLSSADKTSQILDIGCSSGILLSELIKTGFKADNLYGIDISEKAIKLCKNRGINNVYVMDAQDIKLDKKFDFIIASDCLEHLKNDKEALQNWFTLLKKNGKLIVFVPAFNFLWSTHDEVNMHYRRYTKTELEQKLTNSAFNIEKSSYWNFFLFLPIVFVRLIEKIKPNKNANNKQLKIVPINNSLLKLLNFENWLLKFIKFPFGVSTYCIVTKTNTH